MTAIVLIHGTWMTPSSWAPFKAYYEAQGWDVLTPAWPYMDRAVEELRASPDPAFGRLTVQDIADHYAKIVEGLDEPPILIGHGIGGLVVEMLLDRGLGACGVSIGGIPPRGCGGRWRAVTAAMPALAALRTRNRVVTLPFARFAECYAPTLSEAYQRQAYDEFVAPAPGRLFWQLVFGTWPAVNFKRRNRAPLLLMAGKSDRVVRTGDVYRQYKKYRRPHTLTGFIKFRGYSHVLTLESGWREVADSAIDWAVARTRPADAKGPRSSDRARRYGGVRGAKGDTGSAGGPISTPVPAISQYRA